MKSSTTAHNGVPAHYCQCTHPELQDCEDCHMLKKRRYTLRYYVSIPTIDGQKSFKVPGEVYIYIRQLEVKIKKITEPHVIKKDLEEPKHE